uniref:Putative sg1d-like salivary protein n=1 Tax=Anopheles aquasalis TaxID=42839 RepID=T1E7R4_ANOAQ
MMTSIQQQRQRQQVLWFALVALALTLGTTTVLAGEDICTVPVDMIVPALPGPCQPLASCNHQLASERYEQACQQCRVSAATRRDTRAAFPKQLTNWYREQTFFLEELQQLHATHHPRIVALEREVEQGAALMAQLRRKHFIYCIEAGRTKEALLYHATAQQQLTPAQIIEAIRTNKELREQTLLNLLDFIRALPGEAERRELYRGAKPILGRVLLRTPMALVFGIDARSVLPANETDPLLAPMTERYRADFLEGHYFNHDALTRFARDYPRYYVYQLRSITTITQQQWNKMVKVYFFKLAMGLPTLELRLFSVERGIDLLEQFAKKDKNVLEPLLIRLSFTVFRLKKQAEQAGRHRPTMDRIAKLEKRFSMGQGKQYGVYLKAFEKKYVKEWKRMQQQGKQGKKG